MNELQAQTDQLIRALDTLHNDNRAIIIALIVTQGIICLWAIILLIAIVKGKKR